MHLFSAIIFPAHIYWSADDNDVMSKKKKNQRSRFKTTNQYKMPNMWRASSNTKSETLFILLYVFLQELIAATFLSIHSNCLRSLHSIFNNTLFSLHKIELRLTHLLQIHFQSVAHFDGLRWYAMHWFTACNLFALNDDNFVVLHFRLVVLRYVCMCLCIFVSLCICLRASGLKQLPQQQRQQHFLTI